MGCVASRLDNEDVVRRCKERHRLMKEAVAARNHLASAHSDYLRALRLTGATLTAFAEWEPLSVSDHTPPVQIPSPSPAQAISSAIRRPSPSPPPPPLPATPPPLPHRRRFSPSPSPTIASSKLPHILSVSGSPGETPTLRNRPAAGRFAACAAAYVTTPSQASSVWDWENLYPPSPPDSEYFDRLKQERERQIEQRREREIEHHLPSEDEEEEEEEDAEDGEECRREEVRCSDWGENYSSSSASSSGSEPSGRDGEDEFSRSERMVARSGRYGLSSSAGTRSDAPPPSDFSAVAAAENAFRSARSDAGSSPPAEMRIVVRHRSLAEIVAAIDEFFVKAAEAGDPVSELFESSRAQFDRSFRTLKKTVYHSNSVLSHLSSSLTAKPPLAVRYRIDAGALVDSDCRKSHGSTLERLLTWERKLYDEIKSREGVKIEHEKRLLALQSQEYKGKDDSKLDKTKASIKKLRSLIMVTSQAASTTSSAIINVRDTELAPQLVDICYGLLNMWRTMNQFHEVQNHIVRQVRGLVNIPSPGKSTSDLHRLATKDLESAVSSWHSSFDRLIKHQREYIHALYDWLRLTLFSVCDGDGPQKDHSSPVAIELSAFCDEWKQALDRLPDTVASEAIKSFVNVVHVISAKQAEELKIKKRVECYSKELSKKSASLRSVEKKFYRSCSVVGMAIPDGSVRHQDGDAQVFDTRDPLAEKKSEIASCRRKVEDEMSRHVKAMEDTRSMTLNNIQTGLPGVFQAMTGFSGLFAEALQGVCRRAATPASV